MRFFELYAQITTAQTGAWESGTTSNVYAAAQSTPLAQ
jgi:hypothetical protein